MYCQSQHCESYTTGSYVDIWNLLILWLPSLLESIHCSFVQRQQGAASHTQYENGITRTTSLLGMCLYSESVTTSALKFSPILVLATHLSLLLWSLLLLLLLSSSSVSSAVMWMSCPRWARSKSRPKYENYTARTLQACMWMQDIRWCESGCGCGCGCDPMTVTLWLWLPTLSSEGSSFQAPTGNRATQTATNKQ